MAIVAAECPLEIRPMQDWKANRPGLPMISPSVVRVHEVGNQNPGADEEMHVRFVHGGGGSARVSFHFVVGPTKAVQILYLNENAWHASDGYWGEGNRDSIAIETIQIGDFDKTLNHLTWLIAELFTNPARFALRDDLTFSDDLHPEFYLEKIHQHNWSTPDNKNCPQFMRDRGLWTPMVDAVGVELRRRQGAGIPNPATYAQPVFPDWWSPAALESGQDQVVNGITWHSCRREYTALRESPVLATVRGKKVRGNLAIGETVQGRYRFVSEGGPVYVVTKYGSRIRASALSPYISMKEV